MNKQIITSFVVAIVATLGGWLILPTKVGVHEIPYLIVYTFALSFIVAFDTWEAIAEYREGYKDWDLALMLGVILPLILIVYPYLVILLQLYKSLN